MDTDKDLPPPPYDNKPPSNMKSSAPKYTPYSDTPHTSITIPPTFQRFELDPRDTIYPSSPSPALAKRVRRCCCGILIGFVVATVLFYVWLYLAFQNWRF
ncbi:hypothetical protein V6000_008539 [Aspergillus fumigatus]